MKCMTITQPSARFGLNPMCRIMHDELWTYDHLILFSANVDRVVSLLSRRTSDLDGCASFGALCSESVDHASQRCRMSSDRFQTEIERGNNAIDTVLKKLDGIDLAHFKNLFVSDHCIAEIFLEQTVDLNPSERPGTIQDLAASSLGFFLPVSITGDELYYNISAALKLSPDRAGVNMEVYFARAMVFARKQLHHSRSYNRFLRLLILAVHEVGKKSQSSKLPHIKMSFSAQALATCTVDVGAATHSVTFAHYILFYAAF